ncbi:hypothetical protein ml_187 [Mollivirus sibericum]|uniref:hypothetical protein n=1 Tax=Mollivirus sibericum TaxID=1678078 RepID=UPI0006B2E359|nr:hypothetical protein ml_187 [Mollivirus sibericum]ALD61989.1 hypothetical protein ml_187 [Mollivirus sibericum]
MLNLVQHCWRETTLSDLAVGCWLLLALLVHTLSAGCVGLVALFWPQGLLVYASETQASACADCAMAFDLARAFGMINLLTAALTGRILHLAIQKRRWEARQHLGVLLQPMGFFMLATLGLRLCLVASGRFSSAEWTSVVVSAFLALIYLIAHKQLRVL